MSGCHCSSILDFINVFLSPGQRCWRPCQSFLLPFRAQLPPPCGYVVSSQSCRPGWDSGTRNLSGSGGQCLSVTWTPPSLLPLGLPCPCHSVTAGGWTLACHQNTGLVGKKGWQSRCRSHHSQAPQEDGLGAPAVQHSQGCPGLLRGPPRKPPEAPGTRDSSSVSLPGESVHADELQAFVLAALCIGGAHCVSCTRQGWAM